MAEKVKQEIHERVENFLREIEQETGVMICSVSAKWVDVSQTYRCTHLLTEIDLETRKKAE